MLPCVQLSTLTDTFLQKQPWLSPAAAHLLLWGLLQNACGMPAECLGHVVFILRLAGTWPCFAVGWWHSEHSTAASRLPMKALCKLLAMLLVQLITWHVNALILADVQDVPVTALLD